jgi:hypothetical protein|tara:strand:- start:22 stop:408 length:387 start_codon:yes stop_codon:yes gene_type:complete
VLVYAVVAIVVFTVAKLGREFPALIAIVSLTFVDVSVTIIVNKVAYLFRWLSVDTIHYFPILTYCDAGSALVLTYYRVFVNPVVTIIVNTITYFIFTHRTRTMDNLPLITQHSLPACPPICQLALEPA